MDYEDLDLYGDLEEFDYKVKYDEQEKHVQDLEEQLKTNKIRIETLETENKDFKSRLGNIEKSFQSLLETAKAEIKRKDSQIATLRKEKDDIIFRRGGHRPPNHFQANSAKNPFNSSTNNNRPFEPLQRLDTGSKPSRETKHDNDRRETASELEATTTPKFADQTRYHPEIAPKADVAAESKVNPKSVDREAKIDVKGISSSREKEKLDESDRKTMYENRLDISSQNASERGKSGTIASEVLQNRNSGDSMNRRKSTDMGKLEFKREAVAETESKSHLSKTDKKRDLEADRSSRNSRGDYSRDRQNHQHDWDWDLDSRDKRTSANDRHDHVDRRREIDRHDHDRRRIERSPDRKSDRKGRNDYVRKDDERHRRDTHESRSHRDQEPENRKYDPSGQRRTGETKGIRRKDDNKTAGRTESNKEPRKTDQNKEVRKSDDSKEKRTTVGSKVTKSNRDDDNRNSERDRERNNHEKNLDRGGDNKRSEKQRNVPEKNPTKDDEKRDRKSVDDGQESKSEIKSNPHERDASHKEKPAERDDSEENREARFCDKPRENTIKTSSSLNGYRIPLKRNKDEIPPLKRKNRHDHAAHGSSNKRFKSSNRTDKQTKRRRSSNESQADESEPNGIFAYSVEDLRALQKKLQEQIFGELSDEEMCEDHQIVQSPTKSCSNNFPIEGINKSCEQKEEEVAYKSKETAKKAVATTSSGDSRRRQQSGNHETCNKSEVAQQQEIEEQPASANPEISDGQNLPKIMENCHPPESVLVETAGKTTPEVEITLALKKSLETVRNENRKGSEERKLQSSSLTAKPSTRPSDRIRNNDVAAIAPIPTPSPNIIVSNEASQLPTLDRSTSKSKDLQKSPKRKTSQKRRRQSEPNSTSENLTTVSEQLSTSALLSYETYLANHTPLVPLGTLSGDETTTTSVVPPISRKKLPKTGYGGKKMIGHRIEGFERRPSPKKSNLNSSRELKQELFKEALGSLSSTLVEDDPNDISANLRKLFGDNSEASANAAATADVEIIIENEEIAEIVGNGEKQNCDDVVASEGNSLEKSRRTDSNNDSPTFSSTAASIITSSSSSSSSSDTSSFSCGRNDPKGGNQPAENSNNSPKNLQPAQISSKRLEGLPQLIENKSGQQKPEQKVDKHSASYLSQRSEQTLEDISLTEDCFANMSKDIFGSQEDSGTVRADADIFEVLIEDNFQIESAGKSEKKLTVLENCTKESKLAEGSEIENISDCSHELKAKEQAIRGPKMNASQATVEIRGNDEVASNDIELNNPKILIETAKERIVSGECVSKNSTERSRSHKYSEKKNHEDFTNDEAATTATYQECNQAKTKLKVSTKISKKLVNSKERNHQKPGQVVRKRSIDEGKDDFINDSSTPDATEAELTPGKPLDKSDNRNPENELTERIQNPVLDDDPDMSATAATILSNGILSNIACSEDQSSPLHTANESPPLHAAKESLIPPLHTTAKSPIQIVTNCCSPKMSNSLNTSVQNPNSSYEKRNISTTSTDYVIEKVDEKVTNVFITRKRVKKKKKLSQ